MDDVTRAAIKHAEALYKAGRKSEAIEALRKIDDPTARKIFIQLGGASTRSSAPRRSGVYRTIILGGLLIVVIAVAIIVIVGAQSRSASATDEMLRVYCEEATVSDIIDDIPYVDLDTHGQVALSNCTDFPVAARAEFPSGINDCAARTGSQTEFSRCIDTLDIPTDYFDGSYAWMDLNSKCYSEVIDLFKCLNELGRYATEHAEDFRYCYYDYVDGGYGVRSEQCWSEKGLSPITMGESVLVPTATIDQIATARVDATLTTLKITSTAIAVQQATGRAALTATAAP